MFLCLSNNQGENVSLFVNLPDRGNGCFCVLILVATVLFGKNVYVREGVGGNVCT